MLNAAAWSAAACRDARSEEHTSEPSHVSISYAVFCLKKKKSSERLEYLKGTMADQFDLMTWRESSWHLQPIPFLRVSAGVRAHLATSALCVPGLPCRPG